MTPKRGALVDAALVLGGLAYLLPLRHHGLMINDDGWYLHPVLRMLDGEVLYRDVLTFYAPLEHHLFAAVFSLAEPSIVLARTVWVAILVATSHKGSLQIPQETVDDVDFVAQGGGLLVARRPDAFAAGDLLPR